MPILYYEKEKINSWMGNRDAKVKNKYEQAVRRVHRWEKKLGKNNDDVASRSVTGRLQRIGIMRQ